MHVVSEPHTLTWSPLFDACYNRDSSFRRRLLRWKQQFRTFFFFLPEFQDPVSLECHSCLYFFFFFYFLYLTHGIIHRDALSFCSKNSFLRVRYGAPQVVMSLGKSLVHRTSTAAWALLHTKSSECHTLLSHMKLKYFLCLGHGFGHRNGCTSCQNIWQYFVWGIELFKGEMNLRNKKVMRLQRSMCHSTIYYCGSSGIFSSTLKTDERTGHLHTTCSTQPWLRVVAIGRPITSWIFRR